MDALQLTNTRERGYSNGVTVALGEACWWAAYAETANVVYAGVLAPFGGKI